MTPEALEAARRKAKARLVNMVVHEVSLVDVPANERPFLVVKADMKTKKNAESAPAGTPAPATAAPATPAPAGAAPAEQAKEGEPSADTEKEELVLPPEARQAIVDVLGTVIENVSSVASLVADAKTEEGAPVPPALGEMLRKIAAEVSAVADQYASTPEGGAAPPAEKTDEAAAPAPTAAPEQLTVAAIEQAFERVIDRRLGQAEKSADGDTAEKSELAKRVQELSVLVKATHARSILSPLQGTRAQSNANPVQKVDEQPAPIPKRVSWPSDMSAEATKPSQPGPAGSR